MEKHPKRVKGYFGSLEGLAKKVANSEGYLAEFIGSSSKEFNEESLLDSKGGKKYLSFCLHLASEFFYLSKEGLENVLDFNKKKKLFIFGYYGSIKELPKKVKNMRYDKGAKFFRELSKTLEQKSKVYFSKGDVDKAEKLEFASRAIRDGKKAIDQAWDICQSYMKK